MNILKLLFGSRKSILNKPIGCGLNFSRPTDERIAILEMLLWKYHIEGIPNDVFERLVNNGFLRKHDDNSYGWTDITNELGKQFNEKFNYI